MKTKNNIIAAGLWALCLLLGLLSAGCASTGEENSAVRDLGFEVVTKVAVAEALDGNTEAAQKVVDGTALLIDSLESGELVVPQEVKGAAKDYIADQSGLEPATRQALLMVVDSVAAHVARRIDAGQLDPETTARIVQVAGWIAAAAEDTIRLGSPPDYGAPPLPEAQAPKMSLEAGSPATRMSPELRQALDQLDGND